MSETEVSKSNTVQKFSSEKTYIIGIPKKNTSRKSPEFSSSRIFLGADLIKNAKAQSIHDLIRNKKLGLDAKKQYWVCEVNETKLQYVGEFQPDAPPPVKVKRSNGTPMVYVNSGLNDSTSEQQNGAFLPPNMLASYSEASTKNYAMQIKLLQEQLQSERSLHERVLSDKNAEIERLHDMGEVALNRQQILFEETLSYERAQQEQIRENYLKLQNEYLALQNKLSAVLAEKDIIITRARDKEKLQKDIWDAQSKMNAERQKWVEKYSQQQEGLGDGLGNIAADLIKMFGPAIVGAFTGNNNAVVQPQQQNYSMNGTSNNNTPKPQPKIPPIITPMQPPVRTEGNAA